MLQRRVLAVLLALDLVFANAPARADVLDNSFDSPFGPPEGKVPTAKKVVVLTLITGMVASFGASFVFLFQANGAESDRKDLLSSTGSGTDSRNAQCKTPAQCAELDSLRTKRDDASDRWRTSMLLGSGFAAVSVATLILWPNASREGVRVAPQAGTNGTGVVLGGTF